MNKNFILSLVFLFFGIHAVEDVYFVVVAGGVGERLWPLSRRSLPKQFLSVDGKTIIVGNGLG